MTDEPWRRVPLRDVIDLTLSSVDKKTKPNEIHVQLCNYMDVYRNSRVHAGLDFMSATATEREISRCSLQPGDVLITKDSEKHDDIGVPALVADDIPELVCGYHLAILRPSTNNLDGTYLFYALSATQAQQQFHAYANGVTRFGLRKADIGLVEIPFPPLDEQRRIARILGALDDKIELNRRMSQTLEAMAQALFKSWFVDFDPVQAKAEGRPTGLPPNLDALFPDSFQDSELGEIPSGWSGGTLGDVAEEMRRSVKPDEIAPSTPYISLAHMPQQSIGLTQWDSASGIESGKSAFKRGEILFGKLRPYFHKVGIAPVDGVCSTDIVVAAPKSPEWFGFVLGVMASVEFVDYTDAGSTGTRMPRTSWKRMAQYQVVAPPDDVIAAFNACVRPNIISIVGAAQSSLTLAGQRDTLLLNLIVPSHWNRDAG